MSYMRAIKTQMCREGPKLANNARAEHKVCTILFTLSVGFPLPFPLPRHTNQQFRKHIRQLD